MWHSIKVIICFLLYVGAPLRIKIFYISQDQLFPLTSTHFSEHPKTIRLGNLRPRMCIYYFEKVWFQQTSVEDDYIHFCFHIGSSHWIKNLLYIVYLNYLLLRYNLLHAFRAFQYNQIYQYRRYQPLVFKNFTLDCKKGSNRIGLRTYNDFIDNLLF